MDKMQTQILFKSVPKYVHVLPQWMRKCNLDEATSINTGFYFAENAFKDKRDR
jgi:hypothetical protein